MRDLKSFLLSNLFELRYVVEEINDWNGSLDYLEVYENNEDFFEDRLYYASRYDLIKRVANGNYRVEDDLVRFDCYGDLESLDEWEYEQELEENIDDIVKKLMNCYNELDLSDELIALIVEAEE